MDSASLIDDTIDHPDPLFSTGAAGEDMSNKSARVLGGCKADDPRLSACADPPPMEIDDPMAEQVRAGIDVVTARNIAAWVGGAQRQAERQGRAERQRIHVFHPSEHAPATPMSSLTRKRQTDSGNESAELSRSKRDVGC